MILLGSLCCEAHNREVALRLTSHIQPPSHLHRRGRRKGSAKPLGISLASFFLLFKFFIHTIKGTDNQDPFNFICNVGKEWLCPCYSLSLKCLLPTPRVSLETSLSLRQSKLGVAKWIRNLYSHIPPEGKLHLTQAHTLLPQDPGASGKAGPYLPQELGLNEDHDWFRNPGEANQGMTRIWSWEWAVQAKTAESCQVCRGAPDKAVSHP